MNRIFSLFLLTACFFSHAAVEPTNSEMMPLASKSLLLDITKSGNSKLVAVGQHGDIIFSNDAVNWHQANVPVQSTLTAVTFVGKNGWAVGHDAVILHSADAGQNWVVQQFLPNVQKPLFDVLFNDEQNGIAVGAYGQFYRTTDGGKHWVFEFHDEFLNADDAAYLQELKSEDETAYLDERASILPHFNRLLKDGRTLYLVGEIGLIAKSNDFGKNWVTFKEVYQGSFFDIARTNQGNLIAVGLRGHVFRSLKNGSPWEAVETATTASLNSIVLTDEDRLFVLGNNGVLLRSMDDGQNFQLLIQPDGKPLIAGVWFNNQIVAVSDVGIKTIAVK
jgi:photosystem II stability/assembly factor-like uncharacterized protein